MGKPPKKRPIATSINGEVHRATVLKVTGRDSDGSPRTFEMLRDDESTKLEGGEEFWVVYAKASMVSRRN